MAEQQRLTPQIRRYCCGICGVSRSKRSLMLSHMQKSHPLSLSDFSVVGKDQRHYKCSICGDSRSKLALLRKHMEAVHFCSAQTFDSFDTIKKSSSLPETRKRKMVECDECEECGWLAKKPSLLQQHLLSHSVERPYLCSKDGCGKRFKRGYHLKRHLVQHEEKSYFCPWPGCIMRCCSEYNLRRHIRRHDLRGDVQRGVLDPKKVLKCPEPGCSVSFKYPCRLEAHCGTVHGLPYADIRCGELGCGKHFENVKILLQHVNSLHSTVVCQICGVSISRKSFKRHILGHEATPIKQRLFCPFDGCTHSFANRSNLSVHLGVCHLGQREYCCRYDDCTREFGYRHTRDNHERTHCHVQGDFEEADLKFQAGCRGGRKPATLQKVEDLFRKRVACPKEEGVGYHVDGFFPKRQKLAGPKEEQRAT